MSSYVLLDDLHSARITAVLFFGMGTWYVLLAESDVHSTNLYYTSTIALSGSELALLATLSPWFLTYPSISRFSTSRRGTLILRALSLIFGLGAYKLPLPSLRLLAVVLGNVFAWMEVAASSKRLKGGDAARMEGSCE
jgi:hypothetical protein